MHGLNSAARYFINTEKLDLIRQGLKVPDKWLLNEGFITEFIPVFKTCTWPTKPLEDYGVSIKLALAQYFKK
jgi:hypothetical protein